MHPSELCSATSDQVEATVASCEFLELSETLKSSASIREVGPLMIMPLLRRYLENPDSVSEIVAFISRNCRASEVYMFLMEAFLEISSPEIRGLAVDGLAVVLGRSKKPTQLLAQCCSQFLHKFPNHDKFPTALEQPMLRFLAVAADPEIFGDEISGMPGIVWRDSVAVMVLRMHRFMRQKKSDNSDSLLNLFFGGAWKYSLIANYVFDRLRYFRASEVTDLGELQTDDLAWFVTGIVERKKFFKVFSPDFQAELLLRAAEWHFAASENLEAIRSVSVAQKLTDKKFPTALLFQLVQTAVSAPPRDGPLGDERRGLEISDRQAAYLSYCEALKKFPISEAMAVTRKFVRDSNSDSAIGIFVKVGKDAYACATAEESRKFQSVPLEIFGEISGSEFSVLDATDSLSAILNWLRLVLGRDGDFSDRKFVSDRLDIVKRKIDAELRGGEISDLQRTRVLVIGDLTKCVSELLNRKFCCSSH